MSRHRRRWLLRLGRQSGNPWTALRFSIIAKLATGRRKREVARELDVVPSTVMKAARRFVEYGIAGLYDGRRSNGRPKVDPAFRNRVVALLAGSPEDFGWRRPTWTRELLCLEMKRQGFEVVAVCTMGRVLHEIGARLGSPRPVVCCPWPKRRREAVLARIRRVAAWACPTMPVYYADEVDIHLNPRIGRDWMLRGQQRLVVTPGKNVKHYLAGALNAATDEIVWVDADRKNSALFCQLLWQLATKHADALCIHIILDNYIIHSSKITQRVLATFGGRIQLHFLPPYCPNANRIERKWQDLHANVTRNHRCPTMKQLLHNVFDYLRRRNRRAGRAAQGVRHLRSAI
jgi:transposase